MRLSDKAKEMITNTIHQALDIEAQGHCPFFSSAYWKDLLLHPEQYSKKMIKEIERQANAQSN